MTFVHVQPGIVEDVYDRDASLFDLVYFFLTRMVGLSSVALLSIVSGYFIVASLLKTGMWPLIRSKFRTLIIPLIAWNMVMFGVLLAHFLATGKWQDMPQTSPLGIANAFLALTAWPMNVPLWFLRDLFVCCALSPLIYAGLRQVPIITAASIVLFIFFGADLYLLQRPQLILFFSLGMWLRMSKAREETIERTSGFLAVGLLVMTVIFVKLRLERISLNDLDNASRLVLDILLRLTIGAAFWRATAPIRKSTAMNAFKRLEPYAFFLFCSHALVFTLGGAFRRAFGNYGAELFPITFFALPVLAAIAAVVGLQLIRRSGPLLFLFNAGHGVPSLIGSSRIRASA